MLTSWRKLLPHDYSDRIINPLSFKHHETPTDNADQIIGFDALGVRCFYFHWFVLTTERFDSEALPIVKDVYFESVIAWRLHTGGWVKIKRYADQMNDCSNRVTVLPVEFIPTLCEGSMSLSADLIFA